MGSYSLAFIAGPLASFLMVPLYTRYLSPADYGVLELLTLTATIISFLVGSRVGNAVLYYYANTADPWLRSAYISTALIASVIIGACVGAAGSFGAGWISSLVFGTGAYAGWIVVTMWGVGAALPLDIGLCCLRAYNDAATFAMFSLARLILGVLLNVLGLVVLKAGVGAMVYSALLSSTILSIVMCWRLLQPIPFTMRFDALKNMWVYSVPLVFSALGEFSINFADRYFLKQFVSLEQIGLYSLAYKLGMLITYVHAPFIYYWTSQMFVLVKGPEGDKTYTRITTYVVLALTFAALGLTLFVKPFLSVFAGPRFHACAPFIVWLVLANLMRAIASHLRGVFFLEKRTGLEARVVTVGAATCLVAYAVLIPRYGVWGAVWATLGTFVIVLLYSMWLAQKVRRFQFEVGRMLFVVCDGVLLSAGALLLPGDGWTHFFWCCAAFGAFPVSLFVFRFFNAEEKQQLLSLWVRLVDRRPARVTLALSE